MQRVGRDSIIAAAAELPELNEADYRTRSTVVRQDRRPRDSKYAVSQHVRIVFVSILAAAHKVRDPGALGNRRDRSELRARPGTAVVAKFARRKQLAMTQVSLVSHVQRTRTAPELDGLVATMVCARESSRSRSSKTLGKLGARSVKKRNGLMVRVKVGDRNCLGGGWRMEWDGMRKSPARSTWGSLS